MEWDAPATQAHPVGYCFAHLNRAGEPGVRPGLTRSRDASDGEVGMPARLWLIIDPSWYAGEPDAWSGSFEWHARPEDPDVFSARAVSYTHLTLPTNREV